MSIYDPILWVCLGMSFSAGALLGALIHRARKGRFYWSLDNDD